MKGTRPISARRLRRLAYVTASSAACASALLVAVPSTIASANSTIIPGQLLVSTSQWTTNANIAIGQNLPPNCGGTTYTQATCHAAVAPGTYPIVFNNAKPDGSFGVTEPIVLDQVNPATNAITGTITVPNSTQSGVTSSSDQMVTSFSSKSELALNVSSDNNDVTFMGYVAPVAAIDVSNSDTPGGIDTTNTDSANPTYRAVAQLDGSGNFQFTETNTYSGNNGRAAVEVPDGTNPDSLYMVGNGGNGSNPEPQSVVQGVGSQIQMASTAGEASQTPPTTTTPFGSFNITQLGDTADKSAKDDNFRGLSLYNNVIYTTKGSGSNSVNSVYFVDPTGNACPSGGVGIPQSGAPLPTASTWNTTNYPGRVPAYSANGTNPELTPTNMCILKGFSTTLAKTTGAAGVVYPFGVWFANPTTLYVSDEGSGTGGTATGPVGGVYTYPTAANSATPSNATSSNNTGGLMKYSLVNGTWTYDYTLTSGLNLGQSYSVANDASNNAYPTGPNSTDGGGGQPWNPANDGLRNLTGTVNGDGTVTVWAATSTVSGSGDQGTDPNALVKITDTLADTSSSQAAGETFSTVIPATYGQVVRGVSFTPGTAPTNNLPEVPWVPMMPIAVGAIGGFYLWTRSRRRTPAVI